MPLLTTLSGMLLLILLPCWLVHHSAGAYNHLGLGRGHRTLEFDTEPDVFTVELSRYDVPLARIVRNAQRVRTQRYGWLFLGGRRTQGFKLGDLQLLRTEADYGSKPGIFMTTWRLSIPYWLALLATSILPGVWLKRRLTPTARGFPLDQAEVSKAA